MAPRYVLRRVLDLYEAHAGNGVAPELEFFLVEPNVDSDYPLKHPWAVLAARKSAARRTA